MEIPSEALAFTGNKKLGREFFQRATPRVARDLLGKILVHVYDGNILAGKIVETEAYRGESDPASHAAVGKTPRSQIMFGPPGYAYVYLIYGRHHCLNVVTEPEGIPGAVLIRALEPLAGIETMRRLRQSENVRELTTGPGKLCQALGIDNRLNGADLLGDRLYLLEAPPLTNGEIVVSSRVGISVAKNLPWRFFIKDNPFVSRKENERTENEGAGGKD